MSISRKIVHIDCDCFYAAVEMRDNPAWRNRPLAVGGSPERRGVIATCNYVARRFGVRSAMATAHALRLCPELLVIPPRMDVYRQVSQQIQGIFKQYTQLVEPLSLDEAYLDLSAATACHGSATLMAQAIRDAIATQTGITASAGVAPNKLLAKIASDINKPNGQYVIRPEQVDEFMAGLEVSHIPGVGRVMQRKLQALGIYHCMQLQQLSLTVLQQHFGAFGHKLFHYARGIDERPVRLHRVRKSVSVERTFPQDLSDFAACRAQLPALCENLRQRLARKAKDKCIKGVWIKMKFSDFSQTTVAAQAAAIEEQQLMQLAYTGFMRRQQAVRLLGVGVRLSRAVDESADKSQFLLF